MASSSSTCLAAPTPGRARDAIFGDGAAEVLRTMPSGTIVLVEGQPRDAVERAAPQVHLRPRLGGATHGKALEGSAWINFLPAAGLAHPPVPSTSR